MTERCLCVAGANANLIFPSDDNIVRFPADIDYGALLVKAAVFPSIKSAWASGHKGRVPCNWTDAVINGVRVYIWNPYAIPAEPPPWEITAETRMAGEYVWDDDEDANQYGEDLMDYEGGRGWQRGS